MNRISHFIVAAIALANVFGAEAPRAIAQLKQSVGPDTPAKTTSVTGVATGPTRGSLNTPPKAHAVTTAGSVSWEPTPASATPRYAPAVDRDPMQRLCCEPCGPEENGWVRADYLLWAVKGGGVPPLVAQDLPGTPRNLVGVPGVPGQQILLGGPGLNGDLRSGFRVSAGKWLDECRQWAVSSDFFFLGSGNDGGRFSSAGNPPLTRPFIDASTGLPASELVSFPGSLSGAVTVSARNTFWGAGAFLQRNLCCSFEECDVCQLHGYRIDAIAGYRHYSLTDDLRIREDLLSTNEVRVPPGTSITVRDRFRTENRFHGGRIGLTGTAYRGQWSIGGTVGTSIGSMRRELLIEGSTTVQAPGQPAVTRVGGLLAQRTNIGRYTSDTFTFVPEAALTLGYQLTPSINLHVGYTFAYLPNVWRAGDQIDRRVDPIQLTGAASTLGRPATTFASTNAFVQGVNFGATFRY